MNGKQLKNSILQWAIQGKLVPQDPNDEPASVLLEKIRQEKERLIKEKKIKRDKNASIIYRGEDNSYYEKFADGKVVCIDDEIPFELPKTWSWIRLKYVSEIARGGSPRPIKEFLTDSVNGINWIKIGDTEKDGMYINSTKERIKPEGLSKSRLVHKGDFLLTNSMSFGRPYITNIDGCIHDGWLVISPIGTSYMQKFLYYLLSSGYAFSQFAGKVSGAVVKNLNSKKVADALLPLPPYNEQQRILDKLEEIIPKVNTYGLVADAISSMNQSLEPKLRKSILQEAIQGKLVPQIAEEGTAQELFEQIKTEKQKLVKEGKLKKSALNDSVIFRGDDNKYYELIDNSPVCIDEFLPFQIPETWTWCKVKDLVEIQTGASFKKEQANANKKGIRILRGGNILPNKYIFKDDDVFVSEEFVNANTILKKNCIITPAVTSLENIGKMAVIEKDYNNVSAGGFVFIIRPYIQDFNHSLLLAYFLQSPFLIEAMRGITKKSGAAFYNLGKERLKELYLPLPPMAEQRRIVGKINEVLSSIMSR